MTAYYIYSPPIAGFLTSHLWARLPVQLGLIFIMLILLVSPFALLGWVLKKII